MFFPSIGRIYAIFPSLYEFLLRDSQEHEKNYYEYLEKMIEIRQEDVQEPISAMFF